MFSDVRIINVLLNIINSHPHDVVPLTPGMHQRHLNSVPPQRIIYDSQGQASIVMINKAQAIKFLKERYNFTSTSDVTKELKDARSNL